MNVEHPKLPKGFSFPEEPFCEHCGHMEKGEMVHDDGGVSYCLNCAQTNATTEKAEKKFSKLWAIQGQYQADLAYAEAVETLGERQCFVEDDDGHWYQIAAKDSKLFADLMAKDDDLSEFNDTFGDKMLEMHISNYTFLDPKEIKENE